MATCALLVAAGVLVMADADLGAAVAIAGAGVSLGLVTIAFHPWLLGAIGIDVAIVVVALSS